MEVGSGGSSREGHSLRPGITALVAVSRYALNPTRHEKIEGNPRTTNMLLDNASASTYRKTAKFRVQDEDVAPGQ